jgi:hypothetical protein
MTCENALERMSTSEDPFASPECLALEEKCAGFIPQQDDETTAGE